MKTPRWTEAVRLGAPSSVAGRTARRGSPRKARDPTQRHPPGARRSWGSSIAEAEGEREGVLRGGLRDRRSGMVVGR